MGHQRENLTLFISFAAALSVHACAFAVYLTMPKSSGAVPQQTSVVSIELQATQIIEAVKTPQPESMDASDAATDADPGAEKDAAPAAKTLPDTQTEKAPEPVETQNRTDPVEPKKTPEPVERQKAPEPVETKTTEPENRDPEPTLGQKPAEQPASQPAPSPVTAAPAPSKPEANKPVAKKPVTGKPTKTPSKASRKGAKPARAKGKAKPSAARLSASRGQVTNYAAKVRARVASRRPSSGRAQGTVVVSFGISTAGGLRFARVSRSSGNGALDRAALAAVRRSSPFPKPPKGMTSRQLSYSIPFTFR